MFDEYLTFDDVLLLPNYSQVTPSKTDVTSQLTNSIRLKIPLVSSPMDTVTESTLAQSIGFEGGIGIIHRNLSIDSQVKHITAVKKKRLLVGAALGVGEDLQDRLKALIAAHVDVVVIDSSHGHTKHVIDATGTIKKKYPNLQVIAGNVATPEGTEALIKAGADCIRVGMGPGSICTTRIMSGMGVPQLTAIMHCAQEAAKYGIPVMADGGIRTSGDIVKALATGATSVMLGGMFAACDESPGEIVVIDDRKYKYYRGMGSIAAMKKGAAERYGQKYEGKPGRLVPEGVEGLISYKGKLGYVVHQLVGGIRSGMAYLGAQTIPELREKARFVRVSHASLLESHPHSIKVTSS